MDDIYAINVAKSHYRDGFNNSDVEEVLSCSPASLPTCRTDDPVDIERTPPSGYAPT